MYYNGAMARLARVVVPGVPHHVTQRGNRRLATFFSEADYAAYLALMAEWCGRCGVTVWAYCLMPNHVHLIVVPESEDGLRRGIGEAHRRYSRRINFREGWRGHLWQGRFASFAMDERHLMLAARYVELNPVRAKLCRAPWRWRWSSAAAHVSARNDGLVEVAPLLSREEDWRAYLAEGLEPEQAAVMRRHERTGRPLGSEAFLKRLENKLGRILRKKPAGRKPKTKEK
jgi:putative transposase